MKMRAIGLTALGLIGIGVAGIATAQSGSTSGQQQAAAGKGSDQVICRRIQDSGSLARRTRQCLTRAQWDRLAEDSRQTGSTANTGGTSGN
jgi:hypothetical protein